jgi:hypothetical protein
MTDDAYYKAKKNFQKPLDKVVKMWYNESTKRGRGSYLLSSSPS